MPLSDIFRRTAPLGHEVLLIRLRRAFGSQTGYESSEQLRQTGCESSEQLRQTDANNCRNAPDTACKKPNLVDTSMHFFKTDTYAEKEKRNRHAPMSSRNLKKKVQFPSIGPDIPVSQPKVGIKAFRPISVETVTKSPFTPLATAQRLVPSLGPPSRLQSPLYIRIRKLQYTGSKRFVRLNHAKNGRATLGNVSNRLSTAQLESFDTRLRPEQPPFPFPHESWRQVGNKPPPAISEKLSTNPVSTNTIGFLNLEGGNVYPNPIHKFLKLLRVSGVILRDGVDRDIAEVMNDRSTLGCEITVQLLGKLADAAEIVSDKQKQSLLYKISDDECALQRERLMTPQKCSQLFDYIQKSNRMEEILKLVDLQREHSPTRWQKVSFLRFLYHLIDGDLILSPSAYELYEGSTRKAANKFDSGGFEACEEEVNFNYSATK